MKHAQELLGQSLIETHVDGINLLNGSFLGHQMLETASNVSSLIRHRDYYRGSF
jgi:hypothetical protein